MARPVEMTTLDYYLRYEGKYRVSIGHDNQSGESFPCRTMIIENDMEDALIAALDEGLSAEEIADIQLGSIS
jgi:hypothetical protein